MKNKSLNISLMIIISLSLLLPSSRSYAQSETELQLKLRRDFGYGGPDRDIQGNFSMSVSGPENLIRVEYYIDGDPIGESVDSTSFRFKFKTDDFSLGVHKLRAVGYTSNGRVLDSNEITRNFVSAQEGYSTVIKIVAILLGLLIGVSLLSYAFTILLGRNKKSSVELGAPRSYGPLGGTICPKCGKPFSRHIWGLNIGMGKFDRCPHCNKWSITNRVSPTQLRAAELAELGDAKTDSEVEVPETSKEERLRKELEDSRFDDN